MSGYRLVWLLPIVGKTVVLYDINEPVIDKVNKGTVPFRENDAEEVLRRVIKNKHLIATSDPKVVAGAKIVY